MIKKLIVLFFLAATVAAGGAALLITWGYYYYSRDLPDFRNIFDYNPQAVTNVYANDGTLIAEFFDERRYPCRLDEVPLMVQQAFLAAEDSAFYSHFGIDPVGIARAAVKNFQAGSATQGASTITQQVIKNVLLSREKSITRKIKEAILAYRLEQDLTKDEILEIYLNQIYFGNGAYGIKAAAKAYFHKELQNITLAEAAMLAGLPKAPSRYNPTKNFKEAQGRQRYVLGQMVQAGFVKAESADLALKESPKVYQVSSDNIFHAPHYVGEIRRQFSSMGQSYDIDKDGLDIKTALDLTADTFGREAMRKGLREVDKRRGWRGPIAKLGSASPQAFQAQFKDSLLQKAQKGEVYPALVTAIKGDSVAVSLGSEKADISLRRAGWARKKLEVVPDSQDEKVRWQAPLKSIRVGDVIEVSPTLNEKGDITDAFQLDQSPEIEGALVLINPKTGDVLTTIGGYDYSESQFNRVTQSMRQPGSSFKPILYLAALDEFNYTPTTIVDDSPRTFKVGNDFWSPANYDKHYLGQITFRTALQKSRNLVSADIISKIGVDAVIKYARKLGVESPLGRNLSLSLGSSEVTPLEIARAYGVFAAGGVLAPSAYVLSVSDREGTVVYDRNKNPDAAPQRAISEESAFVMASLMKGVVQFGTGQLLKKLERPIAAKTGTSNDQMDAWFVAYTPEWVCGVWVGFDVKKAIGAKETGGKVAAPIWLYFMKDFLAYQDSQKLKERRKHLEGEAKSLGVAAQLPETIAPLDFAVPPGVDAFWINRQTGTSTSKDSPGAFQEYFIKGTKPGAGPKVVEEEEYWDYPEL
jgi:penicillin-binding protein 1A